MAEVVSEMILPGTYIEVRAEGLLSGGLISTGNIGLIGTAEMGDTQVATLSSFEEGRTRYGDPGDWDPAPRATGNVHLVRALRYIFDNGASTVYAQRVLNPASARVAMFALSNDSNTPILGLRAKTPGAWGNRLLIRVEKVDSKELVVDEQPIRSNGVLRLSAESLITPTSEQPNLGNVSVSDQGVQRKYQLQQGAPSTQIVQVNPADRSLTFANPPSTSADITANYWVPPDKLRRVTLRFGNVQEVYTVPSVAYLAQHLQDETNPSKLVEVVENSVGSGLPKLTTGFVAFSQGDNGSVDLTQFQDALDNLVERDIQLLVIVGLPFSDIKGALLGHVERTENLGHERIAVVGADNSDVARILDNANEVADKRIVLVAPGLREQDPASGQWYTLPPYYTAAAVAGKLSSLSPHISPTNKTMGGIDDLAVEYNYGDLKALVQNRVLALQTKRGIRVVRGVTTDDGAFQQISIRRIVDYVKEGTRQRCNQYIGRLNNARVRENLRVTMDRFLADLLTREFLTGYKLTVFADRGMEIRGEVLVTMDLLPTFSIDYVRVVMNLS
jgi:hypothetical protein